MATRHRQLKKGALALFTTAMMLSCAPTSHDEVPTKQTDTTTQVTIELDSSYAQYQDALFKKVSGTYRPYVGPNELRCARLDHANHVRQGTSTRDHSAIGSLPFLCTVRALALQAEVDKLNSCPANSPVTHAITVHYGLNDDLQFVPALQIQCLNYVKSADEYYLDKNDDCYLIDPTDGSLIFKKGGLIVWDLEEGKRYRQKVFVSKSPQQGFRKFDPIKDPHAMIFPYESTVAQVIQDNNLMTNGFLEIVQISTPESYASGLGVNFKGEIAWLPVGVQLVGPVDSYRRFKEKAADLGSPCPPSCPANRFAFKTEGTQPRPGCQNL